jgi:hypothetical protein
MIENEVAWPRWKRRIREGTKDRRIAAKHVRVVTQW